MKRKQRYQRTPYSLLMKKQLAKNNIEFFLINCTSTNYYEKTQQALNEFYLHTGLIPSIGDEFTNLDPSEVEKKGAYLVVVERNIDLQQKQIKLWVTEEIVNVPLVYYADRECPVPGYIHQE